MTEKHFSPNYQISPAPDKYFADLPQKYYSEGFRTFHATYSRVFHLYFRMLLNKAVDGLTTSTNTQPALNFSSRGSKG